MRAVVVGMLFGIVVVLGQAVDWKAQGVVVVTNSSGYVLELKQFVFLQSFAPVGVRIMDPSAEISPGQTDTFSFPLRLLPDSVKITGVVYNKEELDITARVGTTQFDWGTVELTIVKGGATTQEEQPEEEEHQQTRGGQAPVELHGQIIVWEEASFAGEHNHFFGSQPNLHNISWGDRISSFVVVEGRWCLYDGPFYRGRFGPFVAGQYSRVAEVGIPDDSISSLKPCD